MTLKSKLQSFKAKLNSLRDNGEVEKFTDNKGLDENTSARPLCFNATNVNSPKDRYIQMQANPVAYKLTAGISKKLLGRKPIPFIYVDKQHLRNNIITPLTNMDYAHDLWSDDGMFKLLELAFAEGLGVNSSFIFKMEDNTFKVFNRSHIEGDNYWRDPTTRELKQIKVKWNGSKGGKILGSEKVLEEVPLIGHIGKNVVMCQPLPCAQNIFGLSSLLSIWDMCIHKMRNKYYNYIVNKKGGIASRELTIPDNVASNWYKRFEKEALKGVESELITIKYPVALLDSDPTKFVQWKENHVGPTNYKEFDEQLSNDSQIPASFTDGPRKGSLGGTNAEVDDAEIDEVVSNYFGMVEQTIKDINLLFYGIEPNYAIIPYLVPKDEKVEETNEENVEDEENTEDEEIIKEEEEEKIKSHSYKFHSVKSVDNTFIYEGNLWEEGWYDYSDDPDTQELEYLPGDAIKKFIDDPKSVLEGYVDLDHEQGFVVPKDLALARYRVTGYEEVDGKIRDITQVIFPFDPVIKELNVSPLYIAQNSIDKDKKNIQSKLDLRSVALTDSPRSALTGLSTKIKKIDKHD